VKAFKVLLIGAIISVFLAGQVYGAPKGNNSNDNNGKTNKSNVNNDNTQPNFIKSINKRSNTVQVKKVNNTSAVRNRGKSALHKRQGRRSSEAKRKREERNRSSQHKFTLNNDNKGRDKENKNSENAARAARAEEFLLSLERARWSNNSNDTRGQGNMGQVDMKDPFGHDKDSGREKWEHGRPEKEKDKLKNLKGEETAALDLQQDISFEFQNEDSVIALNERLIVYYTSLLESDSLTQEQVDYYEGKLYWLNRAIKIQESKDYITVGLAGENTIGYTLDLTMEEDVRDGTFLIETSLVLLGDFVSYVYNWDDATGTWLIEGTQYYAGDTFVIQSEEVTITGEDGVYEFSYDPDVGLIDGYTGGYFDLVTTITDTETKSTITQTADKSLYVYRDPYGKVEDIVTGQAVIGAKITVYTEDGSIVVLDKAANPKAYNPQTTDATGRFAFNLRTNRKYYMVVNAPGYEEYQSMVFTEKWHVIREDIRLSPINEQMASF